MLCRRQQYVYHGQISLSTKICLPGREIIAILYMNTYQWQQIDSIYLWVKLVLCCAVAEEPQVSLMTVTVTRTIKLPALRLRLDDTRFFNGCKDSDILPQENHLRVLRAKVTFSLLRLLWKCGDRE